VGNTSEAPGRWSQKDGQMDGLSSLVGVDLRMGIHDCYERVVIELEDGDAPPPEHWVRYEPGPVFEDPSGEPFPLKGNHFLTVTIGATLLEGQDGRGIPRSESIVSNKYAQVVQQAAITGSFENVSTVVIGVSKQSGFRVGTLQDPFRLYIDVSV
jgi:hypothetical protein